MRENWTHVPELAGTLTADSFDQSVFLEFEDGSSVFFEYAFTRKEGEWLVVYTEHCGYHTYWAQIVTHQGKVEE